MRYALSLCIAAFTGLASTVAAERQPFEGRVVSGKSLPIHRARVVLYRLDNPRARVTTVTDENGAFSLPLGDLAPTRPNALRQNHPNPFNPSTLIPFEISEGGHVRLDVFNVLGQRVVTLIDEERPAGFHRVRWDGTDAVGRGVSAGVYIYRLSTGTWRDSRKLMLLDGAPGRSDGGALNISEEKAHGFGVRITGEGILPESFTWRPGMGSLVAEVRRIDDVLPPEMAHPETAANPFSGTSLASIIQVVSAYGRGGPRTTAEETP